MAIDAANERVAAGDISGRILIWHGFQAGLAAVAGVQLISWRVDQIKSDDDYDNRLNVPRCLHIMDGFVILPGECFTVAHPPFK